MSPPDVVEVPCGADTTGRQLLDRLAELVADRTRPPWLLIRSADVVAADDAIATLRMAAEGPLVATCSPVPVSEAGQRLVVVGSHPDAPPAAPILLPCLDVCLLSSEALLSVRVEPAGERWSDLPWRGALAATMQRLTNAGWRHLVGPGVAYGWSGVTEPPVPGAGWSGDAVASGGAAQPALDAHRLWASTRLRPVRIVIDGACVSGDVHNGTQVVVLQLSRALAATRPDACVALAVPRAQLGVATELLRGARVEVVERGRRPTTTYDLAYRPYQSIDPSELGWLTHAGQRMMVGQLDLIAFSNPSYHPSAELFHTVRNLQRHMMRVADGVTFISHFGLATALAECPGLADERCHVVGCGVDVEAAPETGGSLPAQPPFVACLSATFHHKNRVHAIRTFAVMCEQFSYPGSLVIAGPEPFYGRSDDSAVVDALPEGVGGRVRRLGHVEAATKWSLLRGADLVLYPSIVEGFGLVPFEAASVGTPSLSFDGTGLAEALAAPPALVQTWDPSIWAARANDLVVDQRIREDNVASVQAAARRHAWTDVAERTWVAIDATIAQARQTPRDEGSRWAFVNPGGREAAEASSARHLVLRTVAALRRRFS